MHIITGIIIGALARQLKKKPGLFGLPHFKTGPIRVAHAIPGRIRFIIPQLSENKGKNKEIDSLMSLTTLKGVEDLDMNPLTGSVVIRYDKGVVRPPQLFYALTHLLGLENALAKSPSPLILKEIRAIGESLNRFFYHSTYGVADLWSVLALSLVLLGGKTVLNNGEKALPAGLTLLWWALEVTQKKR